MFKIQNMNDFSKNISVRLKLARTVSGFKTAKEFTQKHNISPSTYSQHETFKRAMSIENITQYASMMNVDPIWLITGHGLAYQDKNFSHLNKLIFDEQERLIFQGELIAVETPLISLNNYYSYVNMDLFKKILIELIPYLKQLPDTETERVTEFCFDLYNSIVTTNSDANERKKLIKISLESFFKGIDIRVMDEFLNKIAI